MRSPARRTARGTLRSRRNEPLAGAHADLHRSHDARDEARACSCQETRGGLLRTTGRAILIASIARQAYAATSHDNATASRTRSGSVGPSCIPSSPIHTTQARKNSTFSRHTTRQRTDHGTLLIETSAHATASIARPVAHKPGANVNAAEADTSAVVTANNSHGFMLGLQVSPLALSDSVPLNHRRRSA
jgi:hypothetical protein